MDTFLVQNTSDLNGCIEISGSKNACLPLLAAATLLKNNITFHDIPNICDVYSFLDILKLLKVDCIYKNNDLTLNFDNFKATSLVDSLMKTLRASYYLIPTLARNLNRFEISLPGGCGFANRPIDLHQKVFASFGLETYIFENKLVCEHSELHGTTFEFPYKSVGATVNSILMASFIDDVTTLINISNEPEIMCLIKYLKSCGIDITYLDSTVVIKGKKKTLNITNFTNIKDRIEAGTYLILGALKGNPLTIKYCPIGDLESLFKLFDYLNVKYEINDSNVTIYKSEIKKSIVLSAGPYPMFPSDLLPILVSYLGSTNLVHVVSDKIYPTRNQYVEELNKIGYTIVIKNNDIIIFPKKNDCEKNIIESKDIRGGASLIIGAINSNRKIKINGINYVKRGYSNLLNKLRKIGVNINEEN